MASKPKPASSGVALVSRFPPELATAIFRETLVIDGTTQCVSPRRGDSPLVLTEVCREWAAFVKSTPELWSSLSLLLRTMPSSPELFSAGIDMWLTRSSPGPVSFYLSLLAFNRAGHAQFVNRILSTLNTHSHRWLRVTLVPPGRVEHLLPLRADIYSMLEYLELRVVDSYEHIIWIMPILRGLAPALQTFMWPYYLPTDHRTPQIREHVPWPQLTEIDISSYVCPHNCIEVLRRCTRLTKCCLRLCAASTELYQGDPVELPYIHSLGIARDTPDTPDVLQHLLTPNLVEITVQQYPSSPSTFRSFIAHSRCNLQSLKITNTAMSEDVLISYVRLATATLTSLEFGPPMSSLTLPITSETLDLLNVDVSGKTTLAPRLQYISFVVDLSVIQARPFLWKDGDFANMVKSRFETDRMANGPEALARLSRVHITQILSAATRNVVDRGRLTFLVAKGLKVTGNLRRGT